MRVVGRLGWLPGTRQGRSQSRGRKEILAVLKESWGRIYQVWEQETAYELSKGRESEERKTHGNKQSRWAVKQSTSAARLDNPEAEEKYRTGMEAEVRVVHGL